MDVRNFRRQPRGLRKRYALRESFGTTDGLFERYESLPGMIGADVGEYFPHGFRSERRSGNDYGGQYGRERNGNRLTRNSRGRSGDENLGSLGGRYG